MGGGGGGPAAGPRLRHPLLVAGRGLAARARPAPLPTSPVHPRRRLPSACRRLRGRGGHAPRSGHLRLALGLADQGRPLWLSPCRNGTTVSVPAGSYPAGRIGWQLSVKRTSDKKIRQRKIVSKPFIIVLLNCFRFLMGSLLLQDSKPPKLSYSVAYGLQLARSGRRPTAESANNPTLQLSCSTQ